MMVYLTYWDYGATGYSGPIKAFSSREKAVDWCSTRRNYGMISGLHPDAEWEELEVDEEDS